MPNQLGFFPYTPATNLLYGLREALHMLNEEGLPDVFRRHDRHGEATRAAVRAWGLEIVCEEPREYSSSMTAVFTPEGHSADRLREIILENFDMALGAGLGKLAGKAFRIGHLGSFNDLMLAGTLSGVETGLRLAGVPHNAGGVMAALDHLAPADTKSQSSPWPDEGRAIAGRGNVFTQVDSCGIPSGSANGKSTEIARSHVRWIVLLLLCLMYPITYLDRVSLSNTAPFISQEFGFSKATMGVIFSAFVWAYALFQVFGGWLGDRFGLRKVLTIIMAYRTVMAVLTTAAMGFSSFWAVRFMLGVGEAGAFPTATRAMQMWFPRKERGFVQGISHAASRFGAAVGPPPAVAIMIRYGWRIVFYVIGFISLVWCLLFSLIYRNTPEEHKQVSRSELALIRGVDEERRDQAGERPKAADGTLENPPEAPQYLGGDVRILHLLVLPMDLPLLAAVLSGILPRFHPAEGGFLCVLANRRRYVGRCRRRLADRLPLGQNRECQVCPSFGGDYGDAWVRELHSTCRFHGEPLHRSLLLGGRDVFSRNDHRAVLGSADGHWRGILCPE